MELENNSINEENNLNKNNDNTEDYSSSSSQFIYKKKNYRPKEEIQEFIRNNKQKQLAKEIEQKTEKENENNNNNGNNSNSKPKLTTKFYVKNLQNGISKIMEPTRKNSELSLF